ncbi:MAG: hypothetical protein Q9170_000473 [Blastenia crenularia]
MCAALDILGLRSYHWNELLANKNNDHLQLWMKAMQAKYDGVGQTFQGEDFDRMLWNYDSVSDEPCCLFVEELTAAYPDAKVILTTRTPESWLRSVQEAILVVLSWRTSCALLSYFDRDFIGPWWVLLNRNWSVLSRGEPAYKASAYPVLLQTFDSHTSHVRAAVPKERLLEFHPSQGWGPLCSFLDIPVPAVGFPHLNEPQSLVQIRKDMYWERWRVVIRGQAGTLGMISLIAPNLYDSNQANSQDEVRE